jgi:hypothetical protein
MRIAAAILYTLGFICDIWGVLLVVRSALDLRYVLQTGAQNRIDGGGVTGESVIPDLSDVVATVTDDKAHPWCGVALLVVGIAAGTAGNFITLF